MLHFETICGKMVRFSINFYVLCTQYSSLQNSKKGAVALLARPEFKQLLFTEHVT